MPAGADCTVAVDSSLAVPLLLRDHEAHARAVPWRSGRQLSICGHAWIETYAVLTRLPGGARVLPEDAVQLLEANFSPPPSPSADTFAGGASCDGWVALAALEHRAVLATRDARTEANYRRLGVEIEPVP
jgi:predicted nucleic acid-binding protein